MFVDFPEGHIQLLMSLTRCSTLQTFSWLMQCERIVKHLNLDQNHLQVYLVDSNVNTENCSSSESYIDVIFIFNILWTKYFDVYFVI